MEPGRRADAGRRVDGSGAGAPRRRARFDLVCFDVDGTLVTHEHGKVVWQILNERFTGNDRVNGERYLRYTKGEITYADWVALDIGDWVRAGARREEIVAEIGSLRLVEGARETLAVLKDAGARLAVISGTLDVCLDVLFPDHPFDEVFTNRILFGEDGSIVAWEATPFDMEGKAHALEAIAARENIPLARTAFVGDHLNDIAAARRAGFAVAFNPKSRELAEAAHLVVHDPDLRALLPHLLEPPDDAEPARGRKDECGGSS